MSFHFLIKEILNLVSEMISFSLRILECKCVGLFFLTVTLTSDINMHHPAIAPKLVSLPIPPIHPRAMLYVREDICILCCYKVGCV